MKTKGFLSIILLTYLLILFPVNLVSQDLFVAKEKLIVFKQADLKSDTACTIDINEKVEIVEIKKVWLKKWAKIQNSKGFLGYVLFNKLEPIDTNLEIKENNNEEPPTQNIDVKEDNSETNNLNTQDLNKKSVIIQDKNTQENSISNDTQENNQSKTNEHSNKSFPIWGWFAIVASIVLGYTIFQYKKYLSHKFAYNIFSVTTIVTLLLSYGTILFLFYSVGQSETGIMWGIPSKTFKILLTTASFLTVGVLYYYNFRKTNWYFAIFNIIIQSVTVGIFVIIVIGWIILKFLSSKSSSEAQSYSGGKVSSSKGSIKRWGGSLSNSWEWDGKNLKRWGGSLSDSWEWDGKNLKRWGGSLSDSWEWDGTNLKRWGGSLSDSWEWDGKCFKRWGGSLSDSWEIEGNIPIPVIAKAIGII